jgi:hypothetical protein
MAEKRKSGDERPTTPTRSEERFAQKPAGAQGPVGAPNAGSVAQSASEKEVASFIERMKSLTTPTAAGRGRLVFAMDATMSREPTWDLALGLQAEMFRVVKDVGGLDVQLVYFRGAGECRASKWVSDPEALARLMTTVSCRGGHTQIYRVLAHVKAEAEDRKINAVVFVGDAMEEAVDDLCAKAGELGLLGVPAFLFQEGPDPAVSKAFREIARLTGGATCQFDAGSARQLRELLSAVAVYAAGGRGALERLSHARDGDGARRLLSQMK